jgi:MFS family permease
MTLQPIHDRRFVAWLSVAQLISWGSVFYLFALVLEPIERELGLSRAQSSVAFGLALLTEGALAFFVGRLIDQGHERLVMTTGSAVVALCLFLHSFVTGSAGFYAVWIGLGVGMACALYTPAFAVVTRRFPQDFRRAIITMTFLGGLASTVFIPLIAWLFGLLGWRYALWVLAMMHLLVCVPLHFLLLKDAPLTTASKPASSDNSTHLRTHLKSTPYLLITLFIVLLMAVTAAMPAHIISILREQGLSELWVIAIPASIGLIQVFGRLLLYFFEHHFDLHLANRLIPCLLPLGLVALLLAPWMRAHFGEAGLIFIFLFVLLWGMGNGMLTIVKGTAVAQYVNQDHVAALNGAMGVPLAIARATAPIVMGLLWSEATGYVYGLCLMLGLSLLGIAALAFAQNHAQKKS